MLKIYNTLSRTKEEFTPINLNQINMYVCGVTVYDYCHIGHARTYIFFDTIVRYLRYLGYQVNYVRNITDVDDKIIAKAEQQNVLPENITKHFINEMHQDFSALNLLAPDAEPKATDYVFKMIEFIQKLLERDYAYIGTNGDVFYNVNKFKKYGKLAKRELDNFKHSERVAISILQSKQNAQDFVLWKLAPNNQIGWNSPWGYGRPGWHTECATMVLELFHGPIDIHGGGFDLMFPHHENEIAQAEAASEHAFANYWMHVGFLQINSEKMSKSLGNFTTIRELIAEIHPEVIRLFMLSSHYRSQIEFDRANLIVAKNSLEKLYFSIRETSTIVVAKKEFSELNNYLQEQIEKFKIAINDDFNTPLGLSILFELSKEINLLKEQASKFDPKLTKYLFEDNIVVEKTEQDQILAQEVRLIKIKLAVKTLISLGNAIGLLYIDPEDFFTSSIDGLNVNNAINSNLTPEIINNLITERNQARQNKNWGVADSIRKNLLDQGIMLEDIEGKTIWRKI